MFIKLLSNQHFLMVCRSVAQWKEHWVRTQTWVQGLAVPFTNKGHTPLTPLGLSLPFWRMEKI